MSVARCIECQTEVDTDYDAGDWIDTEYMCESCCCELDEVVDEDEDEDEDEELP